MFQSSQIKNQSFNGFKNGFFHILHIEIDDIDAKDLSSLAHAIPDMDILVHRTKSTSEALKKLSMMEFDLCISDISLHARSNLSFIDKIADLYEDLPIILLSSITSDLVVDEGILAGADYVLGKAELSVRSLSKAIEQTMNGHGLFRERRPPTDFEYATPQSAQPARPDYRHMSKPKKMLPPQTAHIFTCEDLDQLRAEVASLNYELEPNLRIITRDRRSRLRDNLYVADLISDTIRASMQIFARKMQDCAFEGHRSAIIANCDPIDVMVILAELLRVLAGETKTRGRMQVELQSLSGRTAITLRGQAIPGAAMNANDILARFNDCFGPGKFAFTIESETSGEIIMQLLFPARMN